MAAFYEARRYGVHSALPLVTARRRCPQAILVPRYFERYRRASERVMAILRRFSERVEVAGLDEAYLDLSGSPAPKARARQLKRDVRSETGLVCSVGLAPNKLLAKIASDLRKPDGLVVVPLGEEAAFLRPLPVRALWGIGPKTDKRLAQAGVRTVGDLAALDAAAAARLLGSGATFFQDMARGVDERAVWTAYERKSVGSETTFARDLPDGAELRGALAAIAAEVAERMRHEGARARTVALKLRYANFRTITRQTTAEAPLAEAAEIAALASRLLDSVEPGDARARQALARRTCDLTHHISPAIIGHHGRVAEPITPADLRSIAVAGDTHPTTVARYLRGAPVRALSERRVVRGLIACGRVDLVRGNVPQKHPPPEAT
jgi:DNA polymerase-4